LIDTLIEEHLQSLIQSAYPALKDDQILFAYPRGDFNRKRTRGGHVASNSNMIGTVTLQVQLYINTEIKIDRDEIIKLLRPESLKLDGNVIRQELQRFVQQDFITLSHLQGMIVFINYIYEINV